MDQKTKDKFSYKKFNIIDRYTATQDIVVYRIAGKINHNPGQFFQVSLPHFGEVTLAPCSPIDQKKYFELCVRSAGSTTTQMTKLLPGDTLDVRGPYGNGWPVGKLIGKNVLILIGGMGIVPLRPLIFELIKYKKEFKKINIVAGFKTPEFVLFEQDFLLWQKQLNYLKVCVEHSSKNWWGETGMITDILKHIKIDPKNTVVLMCGPDIMFKFCNQILTEKGVSDRQIFVSMERRMECGVGLCQHCNIGKYLVCRDGPIFRWDKIKDEIGK